MIIGCGLPLLLLFLAPVIGLGQQIEDLKQRLAGFREEAGPEIRDDGSWSWRIGPGAEQVLGRR